MNSTEIAKLLPEVFQRSANDGSALSAILAVMQELHAPAEAVIDNLEVNFNPYTIADELLPMLAHWVDLTRLMTKVNVEDNKEQPSFQLSSGNGRLRELIAAALSLSQSRGTALGLQRFLEIATGLTDFIIEDNINENSDSAPAFHFIVYAPQAAADLDQLIRIIITQEKPAYVTYELIYTTP